MTILCSFRIFSPNSPKTSSFSRWFGFYLVANVSGQWSTLVYHGVLERKLCKSLRKTFNFHKKQKLTWFPHVFVHKTRHMYTAAVTRGAQHMCAWCAPEFVCTCYMYTRMLVMYTVYYNMEGASKHYTIKKPTCVSLNGRSLCDGLAS